MASNESYWAKFTRQRRTRRNVIRGGLALTSGATLLLMGCSGDDDDDDGGSSSSGGSSGSSSSGGDSGGSGGTSSLLADLQDRSGEAVPGGTLNHVQQGSNSLDAIGSTSSFARLATAPVYNRLLRTLPGVNEPASGEKLGDAVDSWEFSGDGSQLTMKLKSNLGTYQGPPTNGRNLDAEDVMRSWSRWSEVSPLRGEFLNEVNPDAPILSMESPDTSTIVFNLAFPSAILEDQLSDGFYFWVMPRESESDFNPDKEAYGAGPYYMKEFVESSRYVLARNDNFYEAPLPYFDEMNWFIIPEAATALAQFEAKQLDLPGEAYSTVAQRQEGVVDIKNRNPDMLLHQLPISDVAPTARFGYAEGSPMRDVRVRRAISMCYDRASLADVFTNKSEFEAAGLTVNPLWASHISAMYPESGDPSDPSTFGENAKYFAYDLAEAKKLLSAADQENMDMVYHLNNANQNNIENGDIASGQLQNAGLINVTAQVDDFASDFLPNVYRGRGNWMGMAMGGISYKYTAAAFIFSAYHPSAGTAHFYSRDIMPDLVDRAVAITREMDNERRSDLVKEFVSVAAGQMPTCPIGSSSPPYTLKWPWVAQAGVLKQWNGDTIAARSVLYPRFWFDEELANQLGRPS